MSAKAFEVDFGVVMGGTQADGRVAQLVEIQWGSPSLLGKALL
jgi:hypothetical protein